MQSFPVDIAAEQIVRWVREESEAAPYAFRIAARRANYVKDIPLRQEVRLGDQEREELSDVARVATLEVAPAHASDGWLLTIVIEDDLGPRTGSDDAAEEDEGELDLDTFYEEFIRPRRGTASVVAEVEDSAAEARIAHLLNAIQSGRHPVVAE
jgi:hypothetical protein